MNKQKVIILKHYPSDQTYYDLFVGVHLREAIEKEIVKFSHRLEHGKYEVDIEPVSYPDEQSIVCNQPVRVIHIYFNKSDFSKSSLKILNHFAHDVIGSMWETTPSHVMQFDLLQIHPDYNLTMINSILSDDIIEIDDKIVFTFLSSRVYMSREIDEIANKILNKK